MTSLYKRYLKSGKTWYGQVKLLNGQWKAFNTKCRTKRAAWQVVYAAQAEVDAGRDPFRPEIRRGPRLSELIEPYLQSCHERLRPATIRSYRDTLSRVLRQFGDISVTQIDKAAVQAFKAVLEGRSAHSQNIHLAGLRAFLNWAKNEGYLGIWEPPRIKRLQTDPLPVLDYYNMEECRKLLEAGQGILIQRKDRDSPFPFGLFVAVLMLTGLRKSEAHSLYWEPPKPGQNMWPWVDEGQRQIIVPAPIAKGRRARYVPIMPPLQAIFDTWPQPKQGRLFPFSVHSGKATAWWDAVVKAAGVRRLKMHCLRDTFAVQLLLAGTPWAVVGEVLGHQSVETTKRYYAAIGQPELKAAMAQAGNAFATALLPAIAK